MSNQAAWIPERGAPIKVAEAPCPQIKPGYVIVKNAAVALNPIDWKMQSFGILVQSWPAIIGCDVAGEIIDIGGGVSNVDKGDRVMGCSACCMLTGNSAEAAFQQYTLVPAHLVARTPDNMSFEEAAVLPLSVSCAAAALYEKSALGLPLPSKNAPKTGKSVLIWGGSSSVGSSAIQLARASGYDVVTTASPKNLDYVRGLGAATVLDYSDPNVVGKLVDALKGGECVGAFDAIGTAIVQCAEVLSKLGGGHVAATADPPPELPPGVTASHVFATSIKDNDIAKAIFEDYLPVALVDGTFVPSPKPTVVGTGLGEVQAGLDRLKAGVSATILVVTV